MLFCALDIAKALGYKNPSKAVCDHCKHAEGRHTNDSLGRLSVMKFIPQGDVYRLIVRSKLESAEKFEHWIFDVVLQSIQENGGYIANQESQTNEEILANAVLVAQNIIESKDKQIASLEPKAAYFEEVVEKPETITTSTIASLYGWSPQRLNGFLEFAGIQSKNYEGRWVLTENYRHKGYEQRRMSKNGICSHASGYMFWTKKGREFICGLLENAGYKPVTKIGKNDANNPVA